MTGATGALPLAPPEVGALVQVRSRRWLVERVRKSEVGSPTVALACADEDAQGQTLEVFWNHEPDRRLLEDEGWSRLGEKGFDRPRQFAAFLNTLRWNLVTATDPRLFQAPFRAGIKVDAYQMEPLRKALRLPRVNLFLADDTGLGKTIEAGLIARELLVRRRARFLVVATPPSVLDQWKREMEERFGLAFEVLDRAFYTRMRRERGFGVNPWRTHSRSLVSHHLLRDPAYSDPLRERLGEFEAGSLLILDEAHHAAPSGGGRYGIETKFTRAVRDLAPRFQHRLFLSATPHNGHSNSFSALLELLDHHRFTRGVPVRGKADLEPVMVRRLKEDIRETQRDFPERRVVKLEISGLDEDAPELVLSRLLEQYRRLREQRFADASKKARASAGLLTVGLQQRLLSSIEAFARSLQVHRKWVARHEGGEAVVAAEVREGFLRPPDADDERAELTDEEAAREERADIEAASAAGQSGLPPAAREHELLDRMSQVAEEARHRPEAKTRRLLEWVRENQCPGLPDPGAPPPEPPALWNERRLLIFTENREGTRRHLEHTLRAAVAGTDRGADRIEVLTGLTGPDRRKEIRERFNADPTEEPLRILIATDAAREGLNLQAHCADLFHFDLPWNPARIEQRNGRIDRKLQPQTTVRCHYFVLTQRAEDRVLEVLVKKTETIQRELGSMARVLAEDLETKLREKGIPHSGVQHLAQHLEDSAPAVDRRTTADAEMEGIRKRREALEEEINGCRKILHRSREHSGFDPGSFRQTISEALALRGADRLKKARAEDSAETWVFPRLDEGVASDPAWVGIMDSLRRPRKRKQKLADWRRKEPVRPVVFEDVGRLDNGAVHLHLEHRVAERLLARFRTQGFLHHDLARACLVQTRDSIPRVVLLGRLCLYGNQAERLHEELVWASARWTDPSVRKERALRPEGRQAQKQTRELLFRSLEDARGPGSDRLVASLLDTAERDITELRPYLDRLSQELAEAAEKRLVARGDEEARGLRRVLDSQLERVREKLAERENGGRRLLFRDLELREQKQLQRDITAWERAIPRLEADLSDEPQRIRESYRVRARRMEPMGVVYLWPDTG